MKVSPQTLFAAGASIVVLAVVAVGLFLNGSPAQVRRERLDDQRIMSLRAISNTIDATWRTENRFPQDLSEYDRDLRLQYLRPRDPVTGAPFEYRITGARSYELCATFDTSGNGSSGFDDPFWRHGPGRHCFMFTAPATAESPPR